MKDIANTIVYFDMRSNLRHKYGRVRVYIF